MATETILVKSLDKSCITLNVLAPSTFLTPISLILLSAVKAAKPKRPRQEMIMAITAKYLDNLAILSSD